jgi:hypothetical protein
MDICTYKNEVCTVKCRGHTYKVYLNLFTKLFNMAMVRNFAVILGQTPTHSL